MTPEGRRQDTAPRAQRRQSDFRPIEPARRLLLFGPPLLLVIWGCRSVDLTLQKLHLPCGIYRWQVKTLIDPDRRLIRWKPVQASVSDLIARPRPPEGAGLRRKAEEFQLFRVKALLVGVHPRIDQDIHLLLRDPTNSQAAMIAEIPNPECAKGSKHESDFASARRLAETLRARDTPRTVEVWGVGFFDLVRGQIGGAPNGFELHPVIRLYELTD